MFPIIFKILLSVLYTLRKIFKQSDKTLEDLHPRFSQPPVPTVPAGILELWTEKCVGSQQIILVYTHSVILVF